MSLPAARLVALALLLAACGDDPASAPALATLEATLATTTPTGTLEVRVLARDAAGAPMSGVAVTAAIAAGGGAVRDAALTTDAAGLATTVWTLGVAPVPQRVTLRAGDAETTATAPRADGERPEPTPTAFAGVDAWLTAEGREGSTEGLAFVGDTLYLGVPGGLAIVDPDGAVRAAPLSGAPLVGPLGLAAEPDGALWVCDGDAAALVHVSAAGVATTVATADGPDDLVTPNSVAIGPDGLVYFTDSCLGRLMQLDPATGAITARLDFDRATVGGPNGLAFDDAGDLWLTTENTGLLCGFNDVGLTDPIAGLYRVPVAPGQLGPAVPVAERVGLFGDGLAFDAEGHLFALFDTADGLALDESIVYVLPKGGDTLERFFGVQGQVLANLAFAPDAYGAGTLYFALLTVPPFTPPEARGLVRLSVGLEGRPLP